MYHLHKWLFCAGQTPIFSFEPIWVCLNPYLETAFFTGNMIIYTYIYIYIEYTYYSNKLWVSLKIFRYQTNDATMPQAKLPLDLSKLPTPCRSMAQQARCFVGDDAKGAVNRFRMESHGFQQTVCLLEESIWQWVKTLYPW